MNIFHRSQRTEEMEEELRSHVQLRADDLERSGLDRAQAERQARIEFGGRERYKEECHQALGISFFETLVQDGPVRVARVAQVSRFHFRRRDHPGASHRRKRGRFRHYG